MSDSKKAAPKAKAAKKDGPKKPTPAYMFFCQAERPAIKKANPNATFGEIGAYVFVFNDHYEVFLLKIVYTACVCGCIILTQVHSTNVFMI